jgi:hypothetical protein
VSEILNSLDRKDSKKRFLLHLIENFPNRYYPDWEYWFYPIAIAILHWMRLYSRKVVGKEDWEREESERLTVEVKGKKRETVDFLQTRVEAKA